MRDGKEHGRSSSSAGLATWWPTGASDAGLVDLGVLTPLSVDGTIVAHWAEDGLLPSGCEIARRYGRHERLVVWSNVQAATGGKVRGVFRDDENAPLTLLTCVPAIG